MFPWQDDSAGFFMFKPIMCLCTAQPRSKWLIDCGKIGLFTEIAADSKANAKELAEELVIDTIRNRIGELSAILDRLDVCEHGVQLGDYCQPCNVEYKRAREEN